MTVMFKCATPGCRNHQRIGNLCGVCAQAARPKPVKRAPQDIRSTVYSTGETRRSDGADQAQYTDGRQTWWARAKGAAA